MGRFPNNAYRDYPTEAQEQIALLDWAAVMQGRYAELALLFHIPNEGKRSYQVGGQMRRMGLKRGVPDLFLPVARGGYYGLFVEMKSAKGRPTPEQREWCKVLQEQGYAAIVVHGWREAAEQIEAYLKGETKNGID